MYSENFFKNLEFLFITIRFNLENLDTDDLLKAAQLSLFEQEPNKFFINKMKQYKITENIDFDLRDDKPVNYDESKIKNIVNKLLEISLESLESQNFHLLYDLMDFAHALIGMYLNAKRDVYGFYETYVTELEKKWGKVLDELELIIKKEMA